MNNKKNNEQVTSCYESLSSCFCCINSCPKAPESNQSSALSNQSLDILNRQSLDRLTRSNGIMETEFKNININQYLNVLINKDEAIQMITGHFDQIRSKIKNEYKNLLKTKDGHQSADSNNISELTENLPKEAKDALKKLDTELNEILKRFEIETDKYIREKIFNQTDLDERNITTPQEEIQQEHVNHIKIESIEKQQRELLNELDKLEKECISNLDLIIKSEQSKLLSNEIQTLKDLGKLSPFEVELRGRDINSYRLELKIKLDYLINQIKFKVFSNKRCNYYSNDKNEDKLGHLVTSSLINLDEYSSFDLQKYFKSEDETKFDSFNEYYFEQIGSNKDYVIFCSNKKLYKTIIKVVGGPSSDFSTNAKKFLFEHEFTSQYINKIDKCDEFIIVVTQTNIQSQYLHFIDTTNLNEIKENLDLKREISNDYKYLCYYFDHASNSKLMCFFDSQSKVCKRFKMIGQQPMILIDSFPIFETYDIEVIDLKQFLICGNKWYYSVITNGNHSDFIYVYDVVEKKTNQIMNYGKFKVNNNYLIVLEGDCIKKYDANNDLRVCNVNKIIRYIKHISSDGLDFILSDNNEFKFINGSSIYLK